MPTCTASNSSISGIIAICFMLARVSMRITKNLWWNLGLILVVGLYGVANDEFYWREVGHDPYLYDYLFWIALAINGPSGFLADYLSWLTRTDSSERFLIQYALWCVLLWPQWRLYGRFVGWSQNGNRNKATFYAFILLLVIGGGLATYEAWWYGHRPSEFFIDEYFLFVRIGGLTCSGLVLLLYVHILGKQA